MTMAGAPASVACDAVCAYEVTLRVAQIEARTILDLVMYLCAMIRRAINELESFRAGPVLIGEDLYTLTDRLVE